MQRSEPLDPHSPASVPRLRPRDVGAILDQAVVLYRRNFVTYVGIAALMQVPVSLVLTLANILLLDPTSLSTPVPPQRGAGADALLSYNQAMAAWLSDLLSRTMLIVLVAVLGGILLNIATGALARAIADGYMGRPVGVLAAYRAVWPRVPALTGAMLLLLLATTLILVPPLFVWIFVGWSFASQAIVLEGQSVTGALARSWQLVQGSWWRVFGAYLLLLLIGVVVSLSATMVSLLLQFTGASWAMQNIITQFVSLLLTVLYVPIRLAGMTLLYFDLRVRKEGYDLQLALDGRAAELGLQPAPAGAGWPYQAQPMASAQVPVVRPYSEVPGL